MPQLAESVTVGTAILSALNGQRRLLERAVGRHAAVIGELDDTTTAMQRMNRRLNRRRLFWLGVAATLLAAIIFVWWLRWGFGGNQTSSGVASAG